MYKLEKWGSNIWFLVWDYTSGNFGHLHDFDWPDVTYTWQDTSEKTEEPENSIKLLYKLENWISNI